MFREQKCKNKTKEKFQNLFHLDDKYLNNFSTNVNDNNINNIQLTKTLTNRINTMLNSPLRLSNLKSINDDNNINNLNLNFILKNLKLKTISAIKEHNNSKNNNIKLSKNNNKKNIEIKYQILLAEKDKKIQNLQEEVNYYKKLLNINKSSQNSFSNIKKNKKCSVDFENHKYFDINALQFVVDHKNKHNRIFSEKNSTSTKISSLNSLNNSKLYNSNKIETNNKELKTIKKIVINDLRQRKLNLNKNNNSHSQKNILINNLNIITKNNQNNTNKKALKKIYLNKDKTTLKSDYYKDNLNNISNRINKLMNNFL